MACYLIPDPLADTPARRKQVEQIRQDFETRGLERLFPDYFSEITYYPADQFSDGIHFGRPYNTKEVYREKLKRTVSGQRVSGWISNMSLDGVCFLFCVECSTKKWMEL